jgi:VWFA-related protein
MVDSKFRLGAARMKILALNLMLVGTVAPQSPIFRTETRIVEIPVIARDARNTPVPNLTARELHLFDNGVEQNILSFEKFGGSTQPEDKTRDNAPAVRLGPRWSIILLDTLNTPLADQIRGRDGVFGMLRKLQENKDRIAIYVLRGDLRLLCDFTTDPEILRSVLNSYQPEQLPIGAVPFSPPSRPSALAESLPQTPSAESLRLAEQRLTITMDAFTGIARRLKGLRGEKSLVWMTAGFLPPQDPHGVYEVSAQLRSAKARLYPIDARGLVACPLLPCPRELLLPIDMMEELAVQTGGRAYHDSNGLSALVEKALGDSSQGYLLTYVPNNYRQDGSTHRVELQTSRKRLDLRYRSEYVADTPNQ